jgi:hypothetical protein
MIDTLYRGNIYLGEEHYAWVKDGKVCLAKDGDNAYIQYFESREELMGFVAHLIANADLAWPAAQDTHTNRPQAS